MTLTIRIPVVLLALLGSGALLAACSAAQPAPGPKAAPIPVSTDRAEPAALASSFEAGGVVRARSTAVVSSRLLAPVVTVHVRAGDRVRRGAPLVTLDGREIDANGARAAAAVTSAAEAVRAAQSEVRAAQAAVTIARLTHDRIRTLSEKRSATPQELDQAVSVLESADAQLGQAQARLSSANATRDAAQAASHAAAIATSYVTLTAPFDGVVIDRSIDPGSMASPGVGLITVEDSTALRLDVPLDEARATQIGAGDAVEVRVGEGEASEKAIAGRVSEIGRIDPASHSFLVKIDLPAAAGIRSGAFGRARFTGPSRQALVVPASAVVRRGQLTFVFTVDADGRARLLAVSPGMAVAGRIEILAGLRQDDLIVTNPPPSLTDGAPVTGGRR